VQMSLRSVRSRQWTFALPLLLAVGLGGCDLVNSIKQKMGTGLGGHTTAQPASVVAPAPPPVVDNPPAEALPDLPLATIIKKDLQTGHYDEGEKELRHYLQSHPNDRRAQSLLRQLTVDPVQMLGPPARTHMVKVGESYSTVAAHYLGDANLFLVLARYNNATNPSLLRSGTTLRLPASQKPTSGVANIETSPTPAAVKTETAVRSSGPSRSSDSSRAESPAQKARRLESQSVTLYQQGNKDRALDLLDQALTLDPKLTPSGSVSAGMRKELVANYHQRAIVLYRDQHLDQAIALWNRVLAMDPSYEPAAVYRARALELKQRLQQY
jgi:tetratricopeptide (TPR) repeat protein